MSAEYRASLERRGGHGQPIDAEWREGETTVSLDQGIIITNGTRPDGIGRGDYQ